MYHFFALQAHLHQCIPVIDHQHWGPEPQKKKVEDTGGAAEGDASELWQKIQREMQEQEQQSQAATERVLEKVECTIAKYIVHDSAM